MRKLLNIFLISIHTIEARDIEIEIHLNGLTARRNAYGIRTRSQRNGRRPGHIANNFPVGARRHDIMGCFPATMQVSGLPQNSKTEKTMSSKIEWTNSTWNPSVGCTKISPGCANCYAEKFAIRLQAMGMLGYENGFEFTTLPDRLSEPLKKKKPTMFFVNSMSDLFHEDMDYGFVKQAVEVMRQAPQHIFQVLTKRADKMAGFFASVAAPENAWLGVTVENRKHGIPRIDYLKRIDAKVRFLSIEPLLEDLGELDLTWIDWVIVGGESGPSARPMKLEWAESILDQCERARIAFFFKQWGTWGPDGIKRSKKRNGRLLAGRQWNQMPGQK
jgi:protein gp37